MTSVAARSGRRDVAAAGWLERLARAVPLLSVFSWLALLYAWQAWRLETPWVFTDELEFAQLSRSFAEAGETARRGDPHGFGSLYVLLIAPAWLLDDTAAAYETAKYIGVLVMTSSLFPAYALARMLVSPRPALFAAAATAAIPAFMYSSLLLSETLAYPYATLCFFLIARALTTQRPLPIALAVAAALVAPLVRGQLAVIPALFALAALGVFWSGERARGWRAGWSRWDWAGAVLLAVGAALFVSEVISNRSASWDIATRLYKDRIVELGAAAGGAFTIGLGVLPVLVGVAVLARLPGEEPSRALVAFRSLLAASIAAFWLYAGIKAAYISTVFAERVYERNLIYLAPLFFVAMAVWLERRGVRLWALALATTGVGLLLGSTGIQLDYPYFEAPGFSILAEANRDFGWSQQLLHDLLFPVLAVAAGIVLLVHFAPARRAVQTALVAVAAVLVVAWNLTGQLAAANGSEIQSDLFRTNLPGALDWVDEANGGEPTLYLGQQIRDPTGLWLLEFWNRSVDHVWSIDSTAPGPGPTLTPDLSTADGRLSPDPRLSYVVVEPGIDLAGALVAEQGALRLLRVTPPLRLRSSRTGVYSDRWMGPSSAYSRFSTPDERAGTMLVSVSRRNIPGRKPPPQRVTVRLGPLVVGEDRQPALARAVSTSCWRGRGKHEHTFRIATPPPPFRVEVTVDKTFRPVDLDPRIQDSRDLSVQVDYAFVPRRARAGAPGASGRSGASRAGATACGA